jgi:predicted DNA-binding transcriptional regulator AlpA
MRHGTPSSRSDDSQPESVLLKETQVAKLLEVSHRTLQSWRVEGKGPPYRELSKRCIRYDRDEVMRWLTTRRRRSTSDPGPETE